MSHPVERPLSVGYVVSYFHPFASGAERQALAQGLELVRRGHLVHVITRSVPGYPIDDEEYQGLFIHRWIRTWNRGPLFGLSFVSGVHRALRRLRGELDVVHTHQASGKRWPPDCPSPGDGAFPRWCSRPARASTARPTSSGEPGDQASCGGSSCGTRHSRPSRRRSSASGSSLAFPEAVLFVPPAEWTPTIFTPDAARSRAISCPGRAWSSRAACTRRRTCRSCSKPGRGLPPRPRPI